MVSLIHCKVNFLYQPNHSYVMTRNKTELASAIPVITIENKLSFNETICETNQITCEYQHNRLSNSKLNSFHIPTYSFIWFELWESRKMISSNSSVFSTLLFTNIHYPVYIQ